MELDDFSKVEKVRCVKAYGDCLTVGKEYSVLDIRMEVKVKDDEGAFLYWESDHFEPVLDSAKNPLQDAELTPEFEVVEPKFKVGDKVYFPNMAGGEILTLLDNKACHYPFFVNVVNAVNNSLYELDSNGKTKYGNFTDFAVKVTPENHALLCKLYPHIKFEQPPKPLTGSDLCFEKLRNGKKLVICAVSDLSDEKAIKRLQDGDTCIRVIKDCDPAPYHFIDTHGIRHGFAVPLNDETGEPLTQAVLDE